MPIAHCRSCGDARYCEFGLCTSCLIVDKKDPRDFPEPPEDRLAWMKPTGSSGWGAFVNMISNSSVHKP